MLSRLMIFFCAIILIVFPLDTLCASPGPPDECDTVTEASPEAKDGSAGIGLSIDVGFASSYLFRGLNLFKDTRQMDQHMVLARDISWSVMNSGLVVGYRGANQISGDNIQENIDIGLGLEQDLYVTYEWGLSDSAGFFVGLFYYFYPFADEDAAGTRVPSFLEPSVGFFYSTVVDVVINGSYFGGIQDAVEEFSYFYVNPMVTKSFSLTEHLGLDLAAGYGVKRYDGGNSGRDNVHDVLLSVGVPYEMGGLFYVVPSVQLAWTDLTGVNFGDELALSIGFNFGLNL